jgi:PAS domain S-box-containing protein
MTSNSTILVVDDDPKGRQLLENLLAAEGYQVVSAAHGMQALLVASETRPDLVLLDVMMPDMDGFEVCRRLRADKTMQHVPILLLTALDDRDSRLQGLSAGADDFISKPFDSVELRTRLRTITRLNRFRQLFDERSRFETAVAYAPDGMLLTDGAGKISLVNAAFEKLVSKSADDSDRSVFEYIAEAEASDLKAQLAAMPEVGRRLGPIQTQLQRAGRPDTWIELTVGRLPSANGVVLAFNVRDITDKKHLESQLMRSQRIELLGQLAGGIVHDVNNILTAINGNAMLIDGATAEELPQFLENIHLSVRRGAGLLRRILMFARGSDAALEPTSTALLVHETSQIVGEVLGKSITVTMDAPNDLPEIMADANQLHQVLMNFCVNARDAMPDGGTLHLATGRTRVSDEQAHQIGPDARTGDFVTLSVRDSGSGITPEVLAKIFDPFFTTKPADSGTGLGLATVLRVMRRHEGFVGVETELGKGSCFTCFFPIAPALPPSA